MNREHLDRSDRRLLDNGRRVRALAEPEDTLRDALESMLLSNAGCTVCVDGRGRYLGVIELETLMAVLRRMRSEAQAHYARQSSLAEVDDGGDS